MIWAWFFMAMLAGRALSLGLCAACWGGGKRRGFFQAAMAVAWVAAMAGNGWEDFPFVRVWAAAACALLAVEAGGRMGLLAEGKPRITERLLLAVCAAGAWFHPVFVFPCLLSAARLAYGVAGWELGPGYSNLLGFEFIRSSVCFLCAGMAAARCGGPETLPLACACAWQASYYVCHGLAKSALGRHPFSWITQNRLPCLVVNSWLRGWGSQWVGKSGVLRVAAFLGKYRVAACSVVWLLETGWALFFLRGEIALSLLAGTAVFHVIAFLLTGLAGYSYVAGHAAMAVVWTRAPDMREFSPPALVFIAAHAGFLAWWKPKVFREMAAGGAAGKKQRWLDHADHLMAWWDSPYMRMFRYEAVARDGTRWNLPVHRLSPYDTFLTDIHTHVMILRRHPALDPMAEADAALARCGVWGLLVEENDRRKWDHWLDSPERVPPPLPAPVPPWTYDRETRPPDERGALLACFQRHNVRCRRPLYRFLMKRPHFPGEDLVPDVPPVSPHAGRTFAFDREIREVVMFRVKTLYTGNDIFLWDEQEAGKWIVSPPDNA